MEEDCIFHIKTCLQLQKHAKLEKQPTQELYFIISPWPFAIWGIDLIGMINPHFITTTKFTTKWVEAIPIKSFTQDTFIAFLIEKYHHKV